MTTPREAIAAAFAAHFPSSPLAVSAPGGNLAGPSDPLRSVLFYRDGADHWLAVSQGLSCLDLDGVRTPWLELTMRVRGGDEPPAWVHEVMGTIGRYLMGSQPPKRLEPGDTVRLPSPMGGPDSPLVGGGLAIEPLVPFVETAGGQLEVMRLVGLSDREIQVADAGAIDAVLAALPEPLTTDPTRGPVDVEDDLPESTVTISGQAGGAPFETEVSVRAKAVEIEAKGLTAVDLGPAAQCVRAREVSLIDNALRAVDLTPLSGHPRLQVLWLYGNQLQSLDLAPLATMPRLWKIVTAPNPIRDLTVPDLSAAPRLRELRLAENPYERVDLTGVAGCAGLEVLQLQQGALTEIDLSPLASCPGLVEIGLNHNQLRALDLTPLSRHLRLENVVMHHNPIEALDLTPLGGLPALKSVDLGATQLTHVDFSPLAANPNLASFFLYETPATSVTLGDWKAAPRINIIDLGDNRLEALDLSGLAGSPISRLSLSNNAITELDITPLFDCPRLSQVKIDASTTLVADASRRDAVPTALQQYAERITWRD